MEVSNKIGLEKLQKGKKRKTFCYVHLIKYRPIITNYYFAKFGYIKFGSRKKVQSGKSYIISQAIVEVYASRTGVLKVFLVMPFLLVSKISHPPYVPIVIKYKRNILRNGPLEICVADLPRDTFCSTDFLI